MLPALAMRLALPCLLISAQLLGLAGCASVPVPPLLRSVLDTRPAPPGPTSAAGTGAAAGEAPTSPHPPAEQNARPAVLYFGPDMYEVDAQYLPLLRAHAERLQAEPALQLRIDAYTDPHGPVHYNLELARMRAVNVQRRLIEFGAPAQRLQIVAHGPDRRRPQAAQQQRRVELHLR